MGRLLNKIIAAAFVCCMTVFVLCAQSPDEKLLDALRKGNTQAFSDALDEGASPDLADNRGVSILMMAVTFGQTDTVKLLLERGADVNRQDSEGNTALMRAAANGRVEIGKMILAKNPDLYLENNKGESCLSISIAKRCPELASQIMKPGMGELSYQMINSAARSHSEDVFKLIESQAIEAGPPVKPGTLLIPFRNRQLKKFGFVDVVRRRLAIQPQFDAVGRFDGGQCQVKDGKLWGIIDLSGRYVMKPAFEALKGNFGYGADAVAVKKSGKWGFADKAGNLVVQPTFDDVIFTGREDVIPVRVKGQWGFIDKSGNFLVKPTFSGVAASFADGTDIVPVRIGRKWGFVDKAGKVVIQPIFDYARAFRNGLAPVKIGAKWGYAGHEGQIAIPPQFDDAFPFDDYGYACIRDNLQKKYLCIGKNGKLAIENELNSPVFFSKDGIADVALWHVFFRLDHTGRVVGPICFTGRDFTVPPLPWNYIYAALAFVVIAASVGIYFLKRRNKWAVRGIPVGHKSS